MQNQEWHQDTAIASPEEKLQGWSERFSLRKDASGRPEQQAGEYSQDDHEQD